MCIRDRVRPALRQSSKVTTTSLMQQMLQHILALHLCILLSAMPCNMIWPTSGSDDGTYQQNVNRENLRDQCICTAHSKHWVVFKERMVTRNIPYWAAYSPLWKSAYCLVLAVYVCITTMHKCVSHLCITDDATDVSRVPEMATWLPSMPCPSTIQPNLPPFSHRQVRACLQ